MGVRLPEREADQLFEARPIGPPPASIVAFGVVIFLLLMSNGRPIGGGADMTVAFAGKAAASALSAAAAAVIFKAMGRAHGESEARGAAALLALGTSLWATSQSLGPQPVAAFAVAAAVLLLLKAGDEPVWAGRAGLPLGLAIAAWPASAGLAAALALGAAVRWPRKIPWLFFWGLPGIAARLAAQPFLPATFSTGLESLGGGLGRGHLGLLVSPGKGLLVFTPLALVAVVGWVRAWRWGERWLVATLAGAVLAHLALVGASSEWPGGPGWGPTTLNAALPPLFLLLPEGLAALPRIGALLGAISVAVQLLGAFAYDQRWERLYQHPAKPEHPEMWDMAHSPIPFYVRRRVVILAVPALRGGKVFIREHRLVVGGAQGSRITFAGGDMVVKGADATASDFHLLRGARVVGEQLRFTNPGDGLFVRVRPVARLRQLELRIAGRGRGAIAVDERTFWSATPRSREYAVAGDFRIRTPTASPNRGGPTSSSL